MQVKYCVDCAHLEERPIMAETHMDSGVYVQTGWRYVCKTCGRTFSQNDRDIEYQHCVCNQYAKKAEEP